MGTRAGVGLNPRVVVTNAASLLLVVISAALLIPRFRNWPITPDFTMLWAGARFAVTRPHDTYNWAAITAAQMSLRPPVGPLPFPYPPSALVPERVTSYPSDSRWSAIRGPIFKSSSTIRTCRFFMSHGFSPFERFRSLA